MFGYFKKSKPINKQDITTAINTAYDNFMGVDSSDELLAETGKTYQQMLDAVLSDDEVISCREDVLASIIVKKWRVWGDGVSEDDINRLYKIIQTHIDDFSQLAVLSVLGGYAVAEYEFKQQPDGFLTLARVLSKEGELDSYQPQRDGSLMVNVEGEQYKYDGSWLKLKYLVLTSKAVPARPKGEMLAIRAYPAVAIRKRGWAYAGQFIARYAQPYIVGKQSNGYGENISSFVSKVFAFLSGGAIGIGKDDEIEVHQLAGNGEAFPIIEKQANQRIQKLLLGRVKTSELTSGSRASQETDDKVRADRMSAYLSLMTKAIQHALDAIVAVNKNWGLSIYAPNGLWFDYPDVKKADLERAKVTKMYTDTGVFKPTKAYFLAEGYEEDQFEMVDDESTSTNTPTQFSLSATAYKPTPINQVKIHTYPLSHDYCLGTQASNSKQKQAKYAQLMQPKIQAVLSSVDGSESFADFSKKLDELEAQGFDNTGLIDDLSVELASSVVDGLTGKGFANNA